MATSQRDSQRLPAPQDAARPRSTAAAVEPARAALQAGTPLLLPGMPGTALPAAQRRRPLDAASVMSLQRTHGNAHVQRLIAQRARGGHPTADQPRRSQVADQAGVRRCGNRRGHDLRGDPAVRRPGHIEGRPRGAAPAQKRDEGARSVAGATPPRVRQGDGVSRRRQGYLGGDQGRAHHLIEDEQDAQFALDAESGLHEVRASRTGELVVKKLRW